MKKLLIALSLVLGVGCGPDFGTKNKLICGGGLELRATATTTIKVALGYTDTEFTNGDHFVSCLTTTAAGPNAGFSDFISKEEFENTRNNGSCINLLDVDQPTAGTWTYSNLANGKIFVEYNDPGSVNSGANVFLSCNSFSPEDW